MPTKVRPEGRYWVLSKPGEPWKWTSSKHCEGGSEAPLQIGTHTLRGMEDSVRIERMSLLEFGLALGTPEFAVRMERLAVFDRAFLVIEGQFMDLEGVPRRPGLSLLHAFSDLNLDFPTVGKFFVGGHGKTFVASMFARLVGR